MRTQKTTRPPSVVLPPVIPTLYDRYQVMPNKTIRGLNGERFIVRGVNAFQYLFFASAYTSANYTYRKGYNNIAGKQEFDPASDISEPSYQARLRYRSSAWRESEYLAMQNIGVNFIRIVVEPAVIKSTVSYIDPMDGQTYPSDLDMLDTIIAETASYGIVCQLINGQDTSTVALNLSLIRWLKNRYWNHPNVWLGLTNEPHGFANGGADVNNATLWANEQTQYLNAAREDVVGQAVGTKFTNPVCVDPCGWSFNLNLNVNTLNAAPFSTDPNLIINTHYYPQSQTNTNFRSSSEYTTTNSAWLTYKNSYCLIANEVGYAADSLSYDPSLTGTSVNLSAWNNYVLVLKDFLAYADEMSRYSAFSGVSFQSWGERVGYRPSLNAAYNNPTPNSLRIYDANGDFTGWSLWGELVKGHFFSRSNTNQPYPLT